MSQEPMLTTLRRVQRGLRPLFASSRNSIVVLGLSAFFGGLAEALVLLLVVKAALVIAAGETIAKIHVGPIRGGLNIGELLLIALGVALLRFVLQAIAAHVAARM